jgi:hypothetical protein
MTETKLRKHWQIAPRALLCALSITMISGVRAGTLFRFEFNEKSGATVTNTDQSLVGSFGVVVDSNSYPVPNLIRRPAYLPTSR